MGPYEALYRCMRKSLVDFFEEGEEVLIRIHSFHDAMEKFYPKKDRLKIDRVSTNPMQI